MKRYLLMIAALFPLSLLLSNEPENIQNKDVKVQASPYKSAPLFSAEALFWKAQNSAATFATSTSSQNAFTLGTGKAYNVDYDWKTGFRVGAGMHSAHGGWKTSLIYTWFYDKGTKHAASQGTTLLLLTLISATRSTDLNLGQLTPRATQSASSTLFLHLNTGEWNLSKTFIPEKWVSLSACLGVKGAWIYQKNLVDYLGGYRRTSPTTLTNNFIRREDNYWGIGPKAGVETQFWLRHGFSIFGAAAISGVYGKNTLGYGEKAYLSSQKTTVVDMQENSYYSGRAITDLALALRWDSSFCTTKKGSRCRCPKGRERVNVAVAAGWEEHIFFSQGQFMLFNNPSNPGAFTQQQSNLTVQGATLSLLVDF